MVVRSFCWLEAPRRLRCSLGERGSGLSLLNPLRWGGGQKTPGKGSRLKERGPSPVS